MTNRPIYIFGDSFSCLDDFDEDAWYSWPKTLHEKYKVSNYSIGGTGPFLMFNKFHDLLEQGRFQPEDKIIFCLSSPFRIWFDFIDSPNHNNVSHIYYWLIKNNRFDEAEEFINDYNTHSPEHNLTEEIMSNQKFIMRFFELMQQDLLYQNTKNITYLKYISDKHKLKILVFRCFPETGECDEETKRFYPKRNSFNISWNPPDNEFCNLDLIKSEDVNTKTFRLVDDYLELISGRDGIDDDVKKCHLSKENNQIMVNIAENFFFNGTSSEQFVSYDRYHKPKPYIYE